MPEPTGLLAGQAGSRPAHENGDATVAAGGRRREREKGEREKGQRGGGAHHEHYGADGAAREWPALPDFGGKKAGGEAAEAGRSGTAASIAASSHQFLPRGGS